MDNGRVVKVDGVAVACNGIAERKVELWTLDYRVSDCA